MKKAKKQKNSNLGEKIKPPSAEYVLRWLDESNRFIQLFLTPKDMERYRKTRNDFSLNAVLRNRCANLKV